MVICPFKNQFCQEDCALYNTLKKKCNIVAYLEQHLEEKPAAAVTYPNSNTGKDSHSDYWEQSSLTEKSKIQSRFPHDDWDNPTSGWETWRIQDDPVLSSNREYRKNLKEEGF